jgi:hypothetical protein
MYRKLLIILAVFAMLLPACVPLSSQGPDSPTETPYPSPDDPVTDEDEGEEPTFDPQPGDEDLIRGEVEIELAEILTLESFPPQFMLHITGNKGNPCAMLRIVAGEPAEGRIDVEAYIVIDPAAICIQMLESFDVNFPLGSLEGGEYELYLNGELVGEIIAPEVE